MERILAERGVAEAVRFYFRGPLLAGVPKGPSWDAQIEWCAAAATPQGFLGAYRVTIDRPSMADALGAIRSPTLILVGEKDTLYLEDAERMRRKLASGLGRPQASLAARKAKEAARSEGPKNLR